MASEADRNCPERRDFIDATEYLMNPWNKEKLQRLLSDGSWERFVAAAMLSRDKADALYADLRQLEAFIAVEDKMNKESIMMEFPHVKQNLEERIRKLYALADEVDKVHRDCTITQVAASSTGTASGLLTIAGLCLAPFTAGGSLLLSGAGLVLGIAAGVTGVTANMVDVSKDGSAKSEASRLVSPASDRKKEVKEILHHSTPEIASLARRCFQSLQSIVKKGNVLKPEESSSIQLAEISAFNGRGAALVQIGLQMERAFGRTARALGKGAKFLGAGVGLLVDVWDLVKESKHLHEGAKAQLAEELRQQAQELERILKELTRINESLEKDLTP